jgi:transposase-like protein
MRFRAWERPAASSAAEPVLPDVTQCPFCESRRVTTTGDAASASTYWRCHACGEIWNPKRQVAPPRHRGW